MLNLIKEESYIKVTEIDEKEFLLMQQDFFQKNPQLFVSKNLIDYKEHIMKQTVDDVISETKLLFDIKLCFSDDSTFYNETNIMFKDETSQSAVFVDFHYGNDKIYITCDPFLKNHSIIETTIPENIILNTYEPYVFRGNFRDSINLNDIVVSYSNEP